MKQKTEQTLQQLNQELDALLEDVSKYSHSALNRAPSPGAWSAQQTMHHLMLAEKYSVQYCKKKLSFDPKLDKAGLLSHLRGKFIAFYLSTPLKWQAPKAISTENLPAEDNLENIKKTWLAQRVELAQFFKELDDKYWDKDVYKHPFGGRTHWAGMVAFFRAHFKRHRKQIYRALAK